MLAELIPEIAGQEGGKKERKYYIRPSLASPEIPELGYNGRCKRQMVYWAMNFPIDNVNNRMYLVFDDSSWHEELTADWIRKTTWKLRDSQTEIDCGFFGKGHIDGILTDSMGKDYLWEHKAINHFTFQKYTDGNELPIDYISQCCIYLSQELAEYEINQAILLIKNKNTAQYLEFLIEYDKQQDIAKIVYKIDSMDQKEKKLNIEIKDILLRCKEKFEFVEKCRQEKRMPLREYEYSDWQCSFCPYKNKCWEAYEKEFADLSTDIELSNDLEERLAYYLELDMHLKEMEKEQKEIKAQIKQIMNEKDAKRAITERYMVILSLFKSRRIDKNKIPDNILKQAQIEMLSERMTIKLKPVSPEPKRQAGKR